MARSNQHPAVGIDLGTTYSCVGVWERGRVEIIANDQGNRITPSYVSFTDTERLIGDGAKTNAAMNPTNTIFCVKRLIGRRFSDPSVQSDITLWSFTVVTESDDKPRIVIKHQGEEKKFFAEEISAMILSKMKEVVEVYLGQEVKNVVVTVPAYFSDSQRKSTIDAGTIARLDVMRIMDEPTAAAVAYGFKNMNENSVSQNVLIFDLGGGTFDVSVLFMAPSNIEVKATTGDTHLGGEDFDERMVKHFMEEFKRRHGLDIERNFRAMRRLRTACERAKRVLSSQTLTTVQIDCLYEGIDFSFQISQAWFEELNMDLFEKCMDLVEKCLKDAEIDKDAIDVVVLVGGSTRIPMVESLLAEYFQGKTIFKGINPDEAVAYGATVQAALLTKQHSAVVQELVIIDVTPLSIGIELYNGSMGVVLPRNTPIPTKVTSPTTTVYDNQTSVDIKVYEGERSEAKHNNFLGEFTLSGIAPARAGEPLIDVTLEIDANGLLIITAENIATHKKEKITITNDSGRLSNQDIEKMVADADRWKADDEEYKQNNDAWNKLGAYIYKMKNAIRNRNTANSIPLEIKSTIQEAIERASKIVEQRPLPSAAVSELTIEELKTVSHFIGIS